MDRDEGVVRDFDGLGLRQELLESVAGLGYEEPTAIQLEAIPALVAGRDLLGVAATGTGKTAAFALPMLHRLAEGDRLSSPRGLVLAPTRELAMQVATAIHRYGRPLGVRVLPIYGGQSIVQQLRALKRGVDVVVATPGRALDHIRRGTLDLEHVRFVVLDEADEMLDMGFAEDIEAILSGAPTERQTVLFSATFPPRIGAIARTYLRDPVRVEIGGESVSPGEVPRIRQVAYVVGRPHKLAALVRILDLESPDAALVFCRTRSEVDQLTEELTARGYRAEALHGGLSQEQRDRVMKKLRNGSADLVLATDVAARGLDVERLTHVVNYDVPSAPESYVHRIGRVGRAGREGVAVTLAEPREHRLLKNIERMVKQPIGISQLPTVADVRARRLEVTRAAVRETLLADGGELDRFRAVVESLAEEFDLVEIALAAVKMAHAAEGGDPEATEIPAPPPERAAAAPRRAPAGRATGRARAGQSGVARIFIGAGRDAGVRPQDLVGAIANEAGISGREIGAIEISDRFSLVDVAGEIAADVIGALRDSTIKGRKVAIRLEADPGERHARGGGRGAGPERRAGKPAGKPPGKPGRPGAGGRPQSGPGRPTRPRGPGKPSGRR
jgi:ATP-dependent RNA helicase DeaD